MSDLISVELNGGTSPAARTSVAERSLAPRGLAHPPLRTVPEGPGLPRGFRKSTWETTNQIGKGHDRYVRAMHSAVGDTSDLHRITAPRSRCSAIHCSNAGFGAMPSETCLAA